MEIPITEQIKKSAFEYFLLKVLSVNNSLETNDFSLLKVMKLLFFTSAVSYYDYKEGDSLLDNVFNKFKALPFGHVETNIYGYLKNKDFNNIVINNKCSKILNTNQIIENVNTDLKFKIDNSITALLDINQELFSISAFDLVELSHKWYSWQHYYSIARSNERYSEDIPVSAIKGEEHFFYL